jgi:hypothetical protein
MSQWRVLAADPITGERALILTNDPLIMGWLDEYEETTDSPNKTDITPGFNIELASKIKVYVNGLLQREGVSYHYTIDADDNKIVFNTGLVESSWVRIEKYQ